MSFMQPKTTFMRFLQHCDMRVADVGGTASPAQFKTNKTHTQIHKHTQQEVQQVGPADAQTEIKMLLRFVILSLLVSPVISLKCYVCNPSATNAQCNQNNQDCQQPLDTCMTIVDTLGSMTAIVKQCASKATCSGAASTASVDANGNGNTISCCSGYNYCNYSRADSMHTHTALLLLTAGVLLLFAH